MSHKLNDAWLENQKDLFEFWVSRGDLDNALNVCEDISDNGFTVEATTLLAELKKINDADYQQKQEDEAHIYE